jgi:hypothetical protein
VKCDTALSLACARVRARVRARGDDWQRRRIVKTILAGLTITGGGSLRDAQMVESSNFEAVWFVSAEIDGSQMEGDGEIGTWATNAVKDGYGTTYSVDGFAKEFSDWGDGGKTDANLSMSDDGAEESKDCVRLSGSG